MTEKAPELHIKALLSTLADVGAAAAAIDQQAQKVATTPSQAPAAPTKAPPAPPQR